MVKKGVIYARFSSDRQTDMSIEAQTRACIEYANAHGITIVKVYSDEAVSGKDSATNLRHNYKTMLRDAEKNLFDVILIHKYDRVARSLAEHVSLEQKLMSCNVQLIATAQDFGTTNEAKIIRTLMWSLSEYYIDNLAQETRKGHTELAYKALHNGGYAPFGYNVVNQQYVICETEAFWVKKIVTAYISGEPLEPVFAQMKALGITGKRGKPISYSQAYEILNNEKYTGTYVYSPYQETKRATRREKPNAIRIDDAFPAIISRTEFEEVQKIMKSHKQKSAHTDYLCSGLVYCSCGAKMHVIKSTNKGHTYHYYRCSNKCGAKGVPVDTIDTAATFYMNTILSEVENKKILKALKDYDKKTNEFHQNFYTISKSRVAEKEKEYNALMENLATGMLPPSVVASVGERMEQIKKDIETIKSATPPKEMTSELIVNWLKQLQSSDNTVRLLVSRIDVENKNSIKVSSTLTEFLGNLGCGRPLPTLPTILFYYLYCNGA